MVQPNSKKKASSQLDPETYARLKAEINAPYVGLRKFFYIAFAGSGFVGAFIFFFQILARRDIQTALPNFALQLGVIALMIWLWRWEQRREEKRRP